jgi:hypothetical protein
MRGRRTRRWRERSIRARVPILRLELEQLHLLRPPARIRVAAE